jgi:hypothetical protein
MRIVDVLEATAALSLALLFACTPAHAMVGDAETLADARSRPEVMILGSGKTFCSGVAIAPDLVLTAAHCVIPGSAYKRVELDAEGKPSLKDSVAVAQHPRFDFKSLLAHRATADIGLIKLKEPMAATPALMAPLRPRIAPGERFVVQGYGRSVRDDRNSAGTLRAARLIATGHPGTLQLRLVDPATGDKQRGLGGCTGDSGAPAYQENDGRLAVIGVVSWASGPSNTDGCGGLTGVTPLELYRGWIVETARKMGVRLPD